MGHNLIARKQKGQSFHLHLTPCLCQGTSNFTPLTTSDFIASSVHFPGPGTFQFLNCTPMQSRKEKVFIDENFYKAQL